MSRATIEQSSVRNGLLAALDPEDWEQLSPHLEAVDLPFDQTVYAAGGPIDAVFFIETGMVSIIVTLEDGAQVESGLIGPEGLLGLAVVFGNSHSLADARVQLEGSALRIGASALQTVMDSRSALRALLLRYGLAFLSQVTQGTACNARHPIENRLARWLLTAHDRSDADSFSMTHEFMALMLGVNRPGVTIAAGMLSRAGLIRYARGRVTVIDRLGLEAASCECYHTVRHEYARLLGWRPPARATLPG